MENRSQLHPPHLLRPEIDEAGTSIPPERRGPLEAYRQGSSFRRYAILYWILSMIAIAFVVALSSQGCPGAVSPETATEATVVD